MSVAIEDCLIPPHLHASRIIEKINTNQRFKQLLSLCINMLENCESLPLAIPLSYINTHGRFEVVERYSSLIIESISNELRKAGYMVNMDGGVPDKLYLVISIESAGTPTNRLSPQVSMVRSINP